MALGIDDVLMAAAAGISLTDTVVQTVKAYRKKGVHLDIERLIEEVRVTALQRIDEADLALVQFERTLKEKDVDLYKTLQDVISSTGGFLNFEAHRLKRIRRSFNALADATYEASDDVAALVRCRNQAKEKGDMGTAIVASAKAKHELYSGVINAKSVKEAIDLLKKELVRQKAALQ